jgi:hypothetical protein
MSESLTVQLNLLCHLLQYIPDTVPLPQQQSEIIYPFMDYTIDEEWLTNIESEEGVVNHDLGVTFADHVRQNDTVEHIITFHEHGSSLEAVVDIIEKYSTGLPSDPLSKWVEDLTHSALHVYSAVGKVSIASYIISDMPTLYT